MHNFNLLLLLFCMCLSFGVFSSGNACLDTSKSTENTDFSELYFPSISNNSLITPSLSDNKSADNGHIEILHNTRIKSQSVAYVLGHSLAYNPASTYIMLELFEKQSSFKFSDT